MADSETQQQQVTSKTPATKQKNPKRVAAGKAIAQRTKLASEAQKKALIEAQSIIANNQVKVDPPAEPVADPPQVESTKNVLTTTQWLSASGLSFHWRGCTTNAKRSKAFLPKKILLKPRESPHHCLFFHEPLHHRLLMLHQKEKWASERWIEHFIFYIYHNGWHT